ncbi:transketolase C-terminal domain-containing protein [Thermodesulfobium sp. 4217-1]|uniref:transketolase C-terminal domain-containing protein n=1 Tax=Thermodesulfobium sp. 4217-1 TaxID=3120013 RepID=UPI00322202A1
MARKNVGLTGDYAVAEAMRQIDPDVVAVYPITPQTLIVERFGEFVADGIVHTEFVTVESEHSALSACCGSVAAGARTMTCTSSQGLALMHEILYIAAGNRHPIIMIDVNRALSAPINIHGDHSDTMGSRDAGWIHLYCFNGQEAYDSTIIATRIAENSKVYLPVIVGLDAFSISHNTERIELLDDQEVKDFVGEFDPPYSLLNLKQPVSVGAYFLPDYYMEARKNLQETIQNAKKVIVEIHEEYNKKFGKNIPAIMETYKMEDAEYAILAMSSITGVAMLAVDELRSKGIKVGVIRLRLFRPFPAEELYEAISNLKGLAVVERADAYGGASAPIFSELSGACANKKKMPLMANYIIGLGGRDVKIKDMANIFENLMGNVDKGEVKDLRQYIGVKG